MYLLKLVIKTCKNLIVLGLVAMKFFQTIVPSSVNT